MVWAAGLGRGERSREKSREAAKLRDHAVRHSAPKQCAPLCAPQRHTAPQCATMRCSAPQCAAVCHAAPPCATVRHSSAPQRATVRQVRHSAPNRVRSATTEAASSQKPRKTFKNSQATRILVASRLLAAPPAISRLRGFSQRHRVSRLRGFAAPVKSGAPLPKPCAFSSSIFRASHQTTMQIQI